LQTVTSFFFGGRKCSTTLQSVLTWK
jgi:hypothetical protein